ncbi:hypothetical protein [Streptomyces gossypiisoli]|nr:hypothetical protein [Streptomyces gossypiisoli]
MKAVQSLLNAKRGAGLRHTSHEVGMDIDVWPIRTRLEFWAAPCET